MYCNVCETQYTHCTNTDKQDRKKKKRVAIQVVSLSSVLVASVQCISPSYSLSVGRTSSYLLCHFWSTKK